MAAKGLLFQGAVEPFSHVVGLRLGNESKAGGDSPELCLLMKNGLRVLDLMAHTQEQPSVFVNFTLGRGVDTEWSRLSKKSSSSNIRSRNSERIRFL